MSKIGSGASEEKSFENNNGRMHGRTDGRTDDGRKVITIAHPEHSSGELKIQEAHGPQLAHLSEIATADMHLLCNIFLNIVIVTNEWIIIYAVLGFGEEEGRLMHFKWNKPQNTS